MPTIRSTAPTKKRARVPISIGTRVMLRSRTMSVIGKTLDRDSLTFSLSFSFKIRSPSFLNLPIYYIVPKIFCQYSKIDKTQRNQKLFTSHSTISCAFTPLFAKQGQDLVMLQKSSRKILATCLILKV